MFGGRGRRDKGEGAAAEADGIEFEPGELSAVFAAPGWLRDAGFTAWLLVGVAAALAGAVWFLSPTQTIVMPVITAGIIASVAGRRRLAARGCPARRAAWCCSRRRDRGRGRRDRADGIASQADTRRQAARWRQRGRVVGQKPRRQLAQRAARQHAGERRGELRLQGPDPRAARWARETRVARHLPLLHGPEPLLHAQGRADDRGIRRAPPRRARAARPDHPASGERVAARLLRRRHGSLGLELVDRRRRGADPRRTSAGHDRRRDLPRRLHPVPGGVGRRCVRGPDRARRPGLRDCAGDGGDRAARQRGLPAARAAVRLRGRAWPQPARGPDRTDGAPEEPEERPPPLAPDVPAAGAA